ncbi:ATP synthase delta chain [Sulfurospirillum diekertiae]|jgi:F-type H+-transporting ATPase subunit delta|uniref:ATP synthase subunit delta n=1 Tax=Sulfurospirillum diekertiae TaxID=1854492 RepID=A0A290HBA0_9BACT|nr:F0F1 ATP synthase subunit delta [Sulfurospirillum diekertiae]ATB68737.1 ATP synthase delta chain [Sulfurospirillum diekertiae]
MSGAIAKKYVNALMSGCTDSELTEVYGVLVQLVEAFKLEKFINIILSPDVTSKSKEELVLSLVDTKNIKFQNLIKLINSNDRLKLIPHMAKELKYQLSLKNNSFEGSVSTNFKMSQTQVAMLEENFSKKFNAKINLNANANAYPGIKVELDDLGVEVSFSLERLKAQMTEHILKAI